MKSKGTAIGARVQQRLKEFLRKDGRGDLVVGDDADMIKNLGLSSLQGLEFVLDLCDEFEVEFPPEFNPFIHDKERRGRTLEEMVSTVEGYLATTEATNGAK